MPQVLALSCATVDINLPASDQLLTRWEVEIGESVQVSEDRMKVLDEAIREHFTTLPEPVSGGSVTNTADLIARAGVSCALVAKGGADALGELFLRDCSASSLELATPLDPSLKTGYNFCFFNEDGKSSIVWIPGGNASLSRHDLPRGLLTTAELVLIDGFVFGFGEQGSKTVEHTVGSAEQQGIPFVITLASKEIVESHQESLKEYASRAEFVVGNLEQASALVGLPSNASLQDLRNALSPDIPRVIVTLGAAGVFARFNEKDFLVHGVEVKAIDTTGCGDAFLAGFVVATKNSLPLKNALAVGNYVASEVAQHQGARLPRSSDVPECIATAIQVAEELSA